MTSPIATDNSAFPSPPYESKGWLKGILRYTSELKNEWWSYWKITRDRNNQNIVAVAYLLGSLHPYGVLTLDYDLHRADTSTPPS